MAGSTGSAAGAGSSAGKAANHAAGGKVFPENELVLETADAAAAGGAAKVADSSDQVHFAKERLCMAVCVSKHPLIQAGVADMKACCNAGRRQQAIARKVECSGSVTRIDADSLCTRVQQESV